ncbi:MAG: CvpA family protein [Clostridia bacterium]|nr:CvpA family protein [Clostridia bacterium]
MSFLLDGLMVLLLILCMVSGWRRGFIKVFGGLLALAAATLVSAWLSDPIAAMIIPKTEADPALVQLLCLVGLFAIAYALVAFLLRSLNLIAKLPLLKQLNKVLGVAVGAVSGVLWVVFAVCALQMVARLGWIPALTEAVIEKTWLVSWVAAQLPTIGFVSPVVITR